jgi:hypothetical protein
MVRKATMEPWFFLTTGSTLLGAGVSTFIAVLTGGVKEDPAGRLKVIAWAIAIGCALLSGLCLLFAHRERSTHRQRATDILTLMDLIEARFDRTAA